MFRASRVLLTLGDGAISSECSYCQAHAQSSPPSLPLARDLGTEVDVPDPSSCWWHQHSVSRLPQPAWLLMASTAVSRLPHPAWLLMASTAFAGAADVTPRRRDAAERSWMTFILCSVSVESRRGADLARMRFRLVAAALALTLSLARLYTVPGSPSALLWKQGPSQVWVCRYLDHGQQRSRISMWLPSCPEVRRVTT